MKEYLKNRNEYNLDGKRYIEAIGRCRCDEQQGDHCSLTCQIHQRGSHTYYYTQGNGFLAKDEYGKSFLYLSDNAFNTVQDAVKAFDKAVEKAKTWRVIRVPCHDLSAAVYYHLTKDKTYVFYLEYDGKKKFFYGCENLHWLVWDLEWALRRDGETSRNGQIKDDPFYRAACEQGDELFILQLKRFYGIADRRECALLSDFYGYRILPCLSAKYDRFFIFEREDVDYDLLAHSGYVILHRPGIAMKGSTHGRISLNPHTKYGVDAAKIEEQPVPFRDFLALFDDERNYD